MFVRDCLHIRKRLQLVVIVSTETPRIKITVKYSMAAAGQSHSITLQKSLRIKERLKKQIFKRNFERLIRPSCCGCYYNYPDEPNKTINFDLIKYHFQIDYLTNPVITYCNVVIALEIVIDQIISHKILYKLHLKKSNVARH